MQESPPSERKELEKEFTKYDSDLKKEDIILGSEQDEYELIKSEQPDVPHIDDEDFAESQESETEFHYRGT